MRTIILIGSLLFFALQAGAQTTEAKTEASQRVPMISLPVRELGEIPFMGKEDDVMFIIPTPYFEKNITTIDVLPQAGAYRINFPEP